MRLEGENTETEKRIALALGVTLGALAQASSDQLSRLYKKLHLGGGIFSGRPMTEELAKATRYEVLPYLVALAAVLVLDWPQRTTPSESIFGHLEKAVFTVNLEKAKSTYDHYLDRYYHPRESDSASLPRETIIHSEFYWRLTQVWGIYQRPNDSGTGEFAFALGQLSHQNELALKGVLTEIWP